MPLVASLHLVLLFLSEINNTTYINSVPYQLILCQQPHKMSFIIPVASVTLSELLGLLLSTSGSPFLLRKIMRIENIEV